MENQLNGIENLGCFGNQKRNQLSIFRTFQETRKTSQQFHHIRLCVIRHQCLTVHVFGYLGSLAVTWVILRKPLVRDSL